MRKEENWKKKKDFAELDYVNISIQRVGAPGQRRGSYNAKETYLTSAD
jgi:hypothetical protein